MTDQQSVLSKTTVSLDHVAIAVVDLEAAVSDYCQTLGFELIERRTTEGERTGMVSAVIRSGPVTLVLVQGTSPGSQVSRYIDKYGAGVQHVAISVEDLPSVIEDLDKRGLKFSTDLIQGDGIRQAFTARDPNSGMMYEFIERQRPDGKFTDASVRELFRQMEDKDAY